VYLCVVCGSENKQRLFPYTALPGGVCNEDGLCSLLGRQLEFQVLFKPTYSNVLTSHRGGACSILESILLEFLVDNVAKGQVMLRALQLSYVSITPQMLNTHYYLNTTPLRRTSGWSLGTFNRNMCSCGYPRAWDTNCFAPLCSGRRKINAPWSEDEQTQYTGLKPRLYTKLVQYLR